MCDLNYDFVERFESEDEFRKAYERLRSIAGGVWPWESPIAKKNHTDEFGSQIKCGDRYFRKPYGPSSESIMRFSRRSMESILFAVVATSPRIERLGDSALKIEREQAELMHEEMLKQMW